jgi:hypothetical protein
MKRIIVLLILVVVQNAFADVMHTVYFNESDLRFSKSGNFDVLNMKKMPLMSVAEKKSELGKPDMPFTFVHLLIPQGQDVESIMINSTTRQINGSFNIKPQVKSGSSEVSIDNSVYMIDAIYPSKVVEYVRSDNFDGVNRIVTLKVYPCQYLPMRKKVVFNANINFNLNLKAGKAIKRDVKYRPVFTQKFFDSALQSIIDNPQDFSKYASSPVINFPMTGKISTIPPDSCYDYVIITTSTLSSYFDPLKNWLKRKGYSVSVATTQYIYGNYSAETISTNIPDDYAAKIRNYLATQRQNGTGWALIGGGYDSGNFIVPSRYGWRYDDTDDTDDIAPADLYYTDFDGDWAVDADSRYGEEEDDDVDYGPEMWVGRIPCTSSSDIQNWIKKRIDYEQNPGNGSDAYLKKSIMG